VQGLTNFAIFSGNATKVSLCLYSEEDLMAGKTTIEIPLDEDTNRTGDVWHIALQQLDSSMLYAYRVYGVEDDRSHLTAGLSFDSVGLRYV